ncbi:C39 family peptidase [Deinococcus altitudinis]|uniref:C39 family peptidase n=1 Tax=Deinococcus altitudinis TaxID=468914 RepID=UPI0038919ACE
MKRLLAGLTVLCALPWAAALPAAVAPITGIRHEYQRLNNCGPVTVGMAMSRWGGTQNQYAIAPVLKPTKSDKNVGPDELAAYASGQGYGVYHGVNGDLPLMKKLLAAGFPVIVETWFVTGEEGGMGHYRLLTGYDDAARQFSALDSYYGPKVRMGYDDFFRLWHGYLNTFLVVYPPQKEAALSAVVGDHSGRAGWQKALRQTGAAVQNRPADAVALYNLAAAKLRLGDSRGAARTFALAEAARPDPALDPTRPARVTGGLPWRFLWYRSEMLEAYVRVGRNADVLRLTGGLLRDAPDLEEAHYWRGRALAALGREAESRTALQIALKLRPGYTAARAALARLSG